MSNNLPQSNQSNAGPLRARLIKHWARAPYWSLTDGVVLRYDLDPYVAVEQPRELYGNLTLRAPEEAQHQLSMAHRAVKVGALEKEPTPVAFMTWARSIGLEFHPDWWNAVVGETALTSEEAEAPSPTTPSLELKTKERESLLKMVVGMAIKGYSWGPNAQRNKATADIASDLAELGIPLDRDTILKWLRKGAELIPGPEA